MGDGAGVAVAEGAVVEGAVCVRGLQDEKIRTKIMAINRSLNLYVIGLPR